MTKANEQGIISAVGVGGLNKIKCLQDIYFGTSLKKDKVYEARDCGKGWYAVIDESGDEYAYPPELFEVVEERLAVRNAV